MTLVASMAWRSNACCPELGLVGVALRGILGAVDDVDNAMAAIRDKGISVEEAGEKTLLRCDPILTSHKFILCIGKRK